MEKDYNLDFRGNIPNARGTIHHGYKLWVFSTP
jgi:hypothetical protein